MRTHFEDHGYWVESKPYSPIGRWDINYSDILTQLIKSCGKYCTHHASDLFIDWSEIEKELEKGEEINETYIFAIRDMGVDHKFYYNNKLEHPEIYGNPNYHEVWELNVKGDLKEKEITMELVLLTREEQTENNMIKETIDRIKETISLMDKALNLMK